jgi:hypothetical protein
MFQTITVPFFNFFLVYFEVELRTSCLAGKLNHLSHAPSPLLLLVNFQIGSYFVPQLAWTKSLNLGFCSYPGMTATYHHTQAWLKWSLTNFFAWGWSQTSILPISSSQVAMITDCTTAPDPLLLLYF